MIQRIQTVYLLLAAALVVVALVAPLAWFASDAGLFELHAFALRTAEGDAVQGTLYLGVVLLAAGLLPLVTIFLFRRRLLQIRLCVVEAVLLLGGVAMETVYYLLGCRVFADMELHEQGIRPAAMLPLVAILFALLAARAVFRDEMMVRAADRIR